LPCVAAKHPTGLSYVEDKIVKRIISWLIGHWTPAIPPANRTNTTVLRPTTDAIQSAGSTRQYNISTARIDFQGQNVDGIHDRFSIQVENETLAIIHVNRALYSTSLSSRLFRRAFWLSLLIQQEIYVDSEASVPATINGSKEGFQKARDNFFRKQPKRDGL
ncbi:unnamed protein product, partial [Didymodactylos carnosus]